MLALRHGGTVQATRHSAYVCWGCRLRAQQQPRRPQTRGEHSAVVDADLAEAQDGQLAEGKPKSGGKVGSGRDVKRSTQQDDETPAVSINESFQQRKQRGTSAAPGKRRQLEIRRLSKRPTPRSVPTQSLWRGFSSSKGVGPAERELDIRDHDALPTPQEPDGAESNATPSMLRIRKYPLAYQDSEAATESPNPLWRRFISDEGVDPVQGVGDPTAATANALAKGFFSLESSFLAAVDRQCRLHAATLFHGTTGLPNQAPSKGGSNQLRSPKIPSPHQVRRLHTRRRLDQQAAAQYSQDEIPQTMSPEERSADGTERPGGIRAQLRQWQELHGHEDIMPDLPPEEPVLDDELPYNGLTRLPSEQDLIAQGQGQEHQDAAYFDSVGKEGFEGVSKEQSRFMQPGDLVEIDYRHSERESMMAIYVAKVAKGFGQYLMLNGRWAHMPDVSVPYSVSGWIDPKELETLKKHMPKPETHSDLNLLKVQAYTEDLDIPRQITAPLLARLQAFTDEVREIYRRNATALDDAHNILAHETDLRYGSLVSAATALLKIPADRLPLTALFTVRKALANGGFGFNIDRRSHRLTGYMQIRSKEQVRVVERTRHWIRQWQDDLALQASMEESQRAKHRPPLGARVMYSFIEKSREIVARQRLNREPAPESGNVGPSRKRMPITAEQQSIEVKTETQFDSAETDVVKFMEAWSCTTIFSGFPRIESLPPLILSALQLYPEATLNQKIGFMFLQELGTVMPYENRVRSDQHLLLPSSNHSKPLQNLMTTLTNMRHDHDLTDSMADLRHDWRDLPVYCIDDASAQEIDDGISIEAAEADQRGRPQHWLHVHIANPTAFFHRDHPMAKMARHMGETLYMPERTYAMLPRWATQGLFSLAPNRPCLTFSAKLNADGEMVEHKVTPGIIRKVMRVTYDQVEDVIAGKDRAQLEPVILTVGGVPPRPRNSRAPVSLTKRNHEDLRKLMQLAKDRSAGRKRAGGIFFEQQHPEMTVWQSSIAPGLGWDHPWRGGSRTVYGDPVIQLRTTYLKNWFTASRAKAQVMVSEAMLLCSEIAATYCAQRKIPAIYRGTVPSVEVEHPKAQRWKDMLAQGKELPMYLGVPYLQSLGYTVLRTQPLKHAYLGMDHYAKVTSPLRRYGDMILHWQLEAALRHEARTGQSLLVQPDDKSTPDRSFLPFSNPVLDTIMLGLQPRETMITRAKRYSNDFWASMLLFRMHHYQEGGGGPTPSHSDRAALAAFPGALPPGQGGGLPFEKLTVFVGTRPESDGNYRVHTTCVELNYGVEMWRPDRQFPGKAVGAPLMEEARQGDVWEVEVDHVDVYQRRMIMRPVRLVTREGM